MATCILTSCSASCSFTGCSIHCQTQTSLQQHTGGAPIPWVTMLISHVRLDHLSKTHNIQKLQSEFARQTSFMSHNVQDKQHSKHESANSLRHTTIISINPAKLGQEEGTQGYLIHQGAVVVQRTDLYRVCQRMMPTELKTRGKLQQ